MNQAIIDRYIKQPSRLPPDLRQRIEREWKGQPVQLYALGDLHHTLSLTECWGALGARHVAIAGREDDAREVQSFERTRIEAIHDAPGLSANTLTFAARPGDAPLVVLRYTHRQRGAIENIRFVLDEGLAGRAVPPADADEVY